MAKGLAPILFTTLGVVVAGVVGYAIYKPSVPVQEPASIVTQQKQETAAEDIKPDEDNSDVDIVAVPENKLDNPVDDIAAAPEKKVDQPVQEETEVKSSSEEVSKPDSVVTQENVSDPSFDVVRVERDGSAVIAGKANANDKVELLDGDTKLAETTASATGEFAIVLDKPLGAGTHELFIQTMPENGEPIKSKSFAFVEVPEETELGNVTVLLAEVGKPSQVLQKPALETKPAGKTEPEAEVAEVEQNESALTEQAKPAQTSVAVTPVLLEAADIEGSTIFIAGTGEPGGVVNFYLDNEPIGLAKIANNGAFLFEGKKQIDAGRYKLRADMTNGESAEVLARAQVDLVHEPKTEAIKDEEPAQVATQEDVKPESEIATSSEAEATTQPTTQPVEAEDNSSVAVSSENNDEVTSEIVTGSSVIIRRGDNLWTVARRNYGAGIRYTTIFEANRDQVRDPNKIFPGQVLKVPQEQ